MPRVSVGQTDVECDDTNFKPQYVDESTGEALPRELVKHAMVEEMRYFNAHVWNDCGAKQAASSGSKSTGSAG